MKLNKMTEDILNPVLNGYVISQEHHVLFPNGILKIKFSKNEHVSIHYGENDSYQFIQHYDGKWHINYIPYDLELKTFRHAVDDGLLPPPHILNLVNSLISPYRIES